MNPRNKKSDHVRQLLGGTYRELSWFDDRSAEQGEAERSRLLAALEPEIRSAYLGSKLFSGSLSHGCEICGNGSGLSVYLNEACPLHCFFCPYARKSPLEARPISWGGIVYQNPEDLVRLVEFLDLEGIAFTGGEPLLEFKLLESFMSALRERFGDALYIWLYTSGILLDKAKLKTLQDLKLNEIRFNICATSYDLAAVRAAVSRIPKVTVEIPLVPEDYEQVLDTMSSLQDLGVDFLNLHQLIATRDNVQDYVGRGYTFLHDPSLPVFESELLILNLMIQALESGITLPIHYCSAVFKNRFQDAGIRKRAGERAKKSCEGLTEKGYIRRISAIGETDQLTWIYKQLGRQPELKGLCEWNDENDSLLIPLKILERNEFEHNRFRLEYERPSIESRHYLPEASQPSPVDEGASGFKSKKTKVFAESDLSFSFMTSLNAALLHGTAWEQVIRDFCLGFRLRKKADLRAMERERDLLWSVREYELLDSGLAVLF